jgi:hypothetical protein
MCVAFYVSPSPSARSAQDDWGIQFQKASVHLRARSSSGGRMVISHGPKSKQCTKRMGPKCCWTNTRAAVGTGRTRKHGIEC